MIRSAEEFKQLRESKNKENYDRAVVEEASIEVWYEVINKFPELREWVAHNKTVPVEILEELSTDPVRLVRGAVARKRKINQKICDLLKDDVDEEVRSVLIWNTKLVIELKKQIKTEDSDWLKKELNEIIHNVEAE